MQSLGTDLSAIWVYLAASPLLGLSVTLVAFQVSVWINRKLGGTPLLHPVLFAIGLLIIFLLITGIDYRTNFAGAQFVHFLLGPATVALAVPLFDHRRQIRKLAWPILLSCLAGISTAVLSTVGLCLWLGVSRPTLLSLAPKSVTSPIAMGIAEQIGGLPSLTAGLVLITGAIGCILGPLLFRLLRIRNDMAQGFSMGLAAHGFGTAQSFSISQRAGAFAGLGLGLAGVVSAFVLPLMLQLLGLL